MLCSAVYYHVKSMGNATHFEEQEYLNYRLNEMDPQKEL